MASKSGFNIVQGCMIQCYTLKQLSIKIAYKTRWNSCTVEGSIPKGSNRHKKYWV